LPARRLPLLLPRSLVWTVANEGGRPESPRLIACASRIGSGPSVASTGASERLALRAEDADAKARADAAFERVMADPRRAARGE
jgi:hypothetical protein